MSKKSRSKKTKEPTVLKASDIDNFVNIKFEQSDDGFWKWFFEDCKFGETQILDLKDIHINEKYIGFYNIIKYDFYPDADENGCLEIENDLFFGD